MARSFTANYILAGPFPKRNKEFNGLNATCSLYSANTGGLYTIASLRVSCMTI